MKISFITLSLGMGEGGTTEDQHPEAHLLQFHDSLGLFSCLTSIDWEIIGRSIFLFFSPSSLVSLLIWVDNVHRHCWMAPIVGLVLTEAFWCGDEARGFSSLGLGREWQRGPGVAMELARLQEAILLIT